MGCLNPGCPNGPPCPDSELPGCWSTRPLSRSQLAQVVSRYFSGDARVVAYAVARAESAGNPSACRWTVNPICECSVGLFQIFWSCHPEWASTNLLDSDFNTRAAQAISHNGRDWSAWATYNTGSYLNFIDEAEQALGEVILPPPPVARFPASNLSIGPFEVAELFGQRVISVQFYWTLGGPDLIAQSLDLTVYPFGFDEGVTFTGYSKYQNTVPFTGLYPGAGYRWRINSIFPGGQVLTSLEHQFIAPSLPDVPPPPPIPPWPVPIPITVVPPPEETNREITLILGSGLVLVSVILATTPRKKIIKR